MNVLETANVSLQYGELAAVKNVSWSIAEGEIKAIIGPNGAGKTSFFNLLTGLYRPSSGCIRFRGNDVTKVDSVRRTRLGIVRTFQITHVFGSLTVGENLVIALNAGNGESLGLRWARLGADQRPLYEDLLTVGRLRGVEHQRAASLPHGEQRKLEILMALALKPSLLLLDEPAAGMGTLETVEIATLIRDINRNTGLTIGLVEHDMRVVFNLADSISVLAAGELLADGHPDVISNSRIVREAYLGE